MPVNRVLPALSVLALCLSSVLVAGVRPAQPPVVLPPAVAAVMTTPMPSATVMSSPLPSPTVTPSAKPTPRIPDGYRVKVPRLAIDLPIAEGDIQRDAVLQQTPESFAFHLPGTAIPGEGGNAYLYAHARRGMFLTLWSAQTGDEVVVVTPDARELRYVVSEVHWRVDPTDVSWIAPTDSERLTLQTSTGPNPGDPRFIVIALPG